MNKKEAIKRLDALDKESQQLRKIIENADKPTVETIDYESAKQLLEDNNIDPNPEGLYNGCLLKLITIITAVNFIDNNYKQWIPDWTKSNEYKYLPYFEYKKVGGWFLYGVGGICWYGNAISEFYYKSKESANIIGKKELNLYNQIL